VRAARRRLRNRQKAHSRSAACSSARSPRASDLRIPPTSNQAERDLRPSKTQQKISGRLRSETATRNRYAIRGYLDTARKHGTDVITAIRDALAGNPWMPPIPA
jgi:hypothetical protein